MSRVNLNSLDRDVIESVLQMGGGYVLDFTDRTFAEFFRDFDVDIEEERFHEDGRSKAKRLRCFLRNAEPTLAGKVLDELLMRRRLRRPDGLSPDEAKHFERIVVRLAGGASGSNKTPSDASDEAALLRKVFRPAIFSRLPVDLAIGRALVGRIEEAHRCIEANASLAAVILCGSVLEGMCLGFGSQYPERANRGYVSKYGKPAKPFHEWKLREWIEVLGHLGDLSPNTEKFGHALRDFRNYVHPAEQIAHGFSPDMHTARIGFHVVVAAAEDLVRAEGAIKSAGTP